MTTDVQRFVDGQPTRAPGIDRGPLWQLSLRLAGSVEIWKVRAMDPEAARELVRPFRPGWDITQVERWDGEWARVELERPTGERGA
jgi:hypothetical protein